MNPRAAPTLEGTVISQHLDFMTQIWTPLTLFTLCNAARSIVGFLSCTFIFYISMKPCKSSGYVKSGFLAFVSHLGNSTLALKTIP